MARNGINVVDLFCGAGGLTHGLTRSGLNVTLAVDSDPACRYPIESNNEAKFLLKDVSQLSAREVKANFERSSAKILVGCAPCQPFSKYTRGGKAQRDAKWRLLNQFGRLVEEVRPEVVSMENVPGLKSDPSFDSFINTLRRLNYFVSFSTVFCPDYGIPQLRKRLVLFASRLNHISIIAPTHRPSRYKTVKSAISRLPKIEAGEVASADPMHRSSDLTRVCFKTI